MAATSTVTKIQVKLQLDNGTTASGNVKTVAVTFPNISVSGYDPTKALNIANAAEDVLSKSIYVVEDIKTGRVDEA